MIPVGNFLAWLMSRPGGVRFFNFMTNSLKGNNIKGLTCEKTYIPSQNGGDNIRVRIYRPLHVNGPLPGLLYLHGGGYMVGSPELSPAFIKGYIDKRPCVIIAPDYRKSAQHPFPAGFNDCYDTLLWMKENAEVLGIQSGPLIVGGHSAGGGMTAAVTLKARDTKDVDIAFQMPIYPMIDHRQENESSRKFQQVPVWNGASNRLAWSYYLQNVGDNVPPYAAPILNKDYSDFPPTITFVGDMEPFRDETIAYVEALKQQGIPVKFELFKGAYHGFEIFGAKTDIGKRANDFMYNAFAEYYDKYVGAATGVAAG